MGSGEIEPSQTPLSMMMMQQPARDLMNKRSQQPVRSELPTHQPRQTRQTRQTIAVNQRIQQFEESSQSGQHSYRNGEQLTMRDLEESKLSFEPPTISTIAIVED